MAIVVEVISQLEKYAITKEALEVILFCILNYTMKKKTFKISLLACTLPIAKILSVENARAWVSMVFT